MAERSSAVRRRCSTAVSLRVGPRYSLATPCSTAWLSSTGPRAAHSHPWQSRSNHAMTGYGAPTVIVQQPHGASVGSAMQPKAVALFASSLGRFSCGHPGWYAAVHADSNVHLAAIDGQASAAVQFGLAICGSFVVLVHIRFSQWMYARSINDGRRYITALATTLMLYISPIVLLRGMVKPHAHHGMLPVCHMHAACVLYVFLACAYVVCLLRVSHVVCMLHVSCYQCRRGFHPTNVCDHCAAWDVGQRSTVSSWRSPRHRSTRSPMCGRCCAKSLHCTASCCIALHRTALQCLHTCRGLQLAMRGRPMAQCSWYMASQCTVPNHSSLSLRTDCFQTKA